MDYWGAKGYVAPPLKLLGGGGGGGAGPPGPPLPTPMANTTHVSYHDPIQCRDRSVIIATMG